MEDLMKKHVFLYLFLSLALVLTGCSKGGDSAAVSGKAAGAVADVGELIPVEASIVGTIDIGGITSIKLLASMKDKIAEEEAKIGIKFSDFGNLAFFVTGSLKDKKPQAAFFTKADLSKMADKAKSTQTHGGVTIHVMDEDSGFAQVKGFTVMGMLPAIKASIDASGGKNLKNSPRQALFNEVLAHVGGAIMTLGFIPDAQTLADMKKGAAQAGPLAGFIENISAAAIGLDYKSDALVITLAGRSVAAAAKTAADTIKQQVPQAKPMAEMYAGQLGADGKKWIKQIFDSFKAEADGDFLKIGIALPEKMLETLFTQFAGMFGNMGGGQADPDLEDNE
jgi:hypothetical protein